MRILEILVAGERSGAAFDAAIDAATPEDVASVVGLTTDPESDLRRASMLVLPLLTHGDSPTIDMVQAAVTLTSDPEPQVRDAACFALGQQWREVNTDDVRDALAARLNDPDPDTRCEALLGLAVRRDPRALPRVRDALTRPDGGTWRLELIAAGALSDPSLHELVLQHQSGWDDDPEAVPTADLVRRLTDPAGVGDDVIAEVYELHRRRAHHEPDGDPHAWRVMSSLLDIAPWRAPELLQLVLQSAADDPETLYEIRTNSALAQDAAGA